MNRIPIFVAAVAAAMLAMAAPVRAQSPDVHVPQGTVVPGNGAAGMHTLNLTAADIGVLIETVSQITGRSFIVDPRVEGRVTVISSRPMPPEEIYQTFLSVLRVHGYAAVPAAAGTVKIVPEAVAIQEGGALIGTGGGPDELVTRVIELEHVSATELVQWLRPLLPQTGHLAAQGGALVLTDRAGNVERIERIVRRIDRSGDETVEVIALQHANASEVARTLQSLARAPAAPGIIAPQIQVVADARTNSVLLSGDPAQRVRLRALIAHLDTPMEGSEFTQVVFLRYAKADDLVPILENVAASLAGYDLKAEGAKPASVQPHAETNALVITAAPAVVRSLESIVRQLDVRRAQVLIEAVIAEVSDDFVDEFGVQWQSTNFDGNEGYIGGTNFPGSSGTGGIVGALTNPLGAVGGSGLNMGYIGGRVTIPNPTGEGEITVFQVGALVKALRGDTRANVLSQPSVVTLDNHEAEFKVVQEVPFLTGQYVNTSTTGGTNQPTNPFQTIQREDVGLILTVTPHINEGDSVRMDIRQEVSSLAPTPANAVDLVTNKRELTTSVLVPDGGLLVLGGLISEEVTENLQGVPGLSRIPLLGHLFKSRANNRSKRNLMVFLRPIILRDALTETAMSSDKYNFLRAEQLRLQQAAEQRIGAPPQPVLPPLPDARDPDLMQRPPPLRRRAPHMDREP
ncbi:MAG TPA: type II secretion system secretin GspD [Xanthomonadaceae bacterium]|nr:type II secretion system secretin GspD [Xanthomonadaceae bacterium]